MKHLIALLLACQVFFVNAQVTLETFQSYKDYDIVVVMPRDNCKIIQSMFVYDARNSSEKKKQIVLSMVHFAKTRIYMAQDKLEFWRKLVAKANLELEGEEVNTKVHIIDISKCKKEAPL